VVSHPKGGLSAQIARVYSQGLEHDHVKDSDDSIGILQLKPEDFGDIHGSLLRASNGVVNKIAVLVFTPIALAVLAKSVQNGRIFTKFDIVFIDEAGRCAESLLYIPLSIVIIGLTVIDETILLFVVCGCISLLIAGHCFHVNESADSRYHGAAIGY
jgi:hypothetical protein